MIIDLEVAAALPSTTNLREHPLARKSRVERVHETVLEALEGCGRAPGAVLAEAAGGVLVVRLTRSAPRGLDDDNLAGSLKAARDAVAKWLEVDDRELERVRYFVYQAKGPTIVRQPVGRQRKVRKLQGLRIQLRAVDVPTWLGEELEALRHAAELAQLRFEAAAAAAKKARKAGRLEAQAAEWLGLDLSESTAAPTQEA